LALAGNDGGGCESGGAGARGGCGGVGASSGSSLDGDGGGYGCGAGDDVLEGAGLEVGAVRADGELLEVGHGLAACSQGVDAEDHADAAVRAGLLLAVEPWGLSVGAQRAILLDDLHKGSALGTVMFHVTPALPSGLGMKPESIPPSIFSQGLANVDCVTVWFFCMKINSTVSPTAAVMDSGVYCNTGAMPVATGFTPPTTTWELLNCAHDLLG
jgi:hypothetical protein